MQKQSKKYSDCKHVNNQSLIVNIPSTEEMFTILQLYQQHGKQYFLLPGQTQDTVNEWKQSEKGEEEKRVSGAEPGNSGPGVVDLKLYCCCFCSIWKCKVKQ